MKTLIFVCRFYKGVLRKNFSSIIVTCLLKYYLNLRTSMVIQHKPKASVVQKLPFKFYSNSLLGSLPLGLVFFVHKRVRMGQKIYGLAYYELCERECVCVVFFVLLRAFGAHGLLYTPSRSIHHNIIYTLLGAFAFFPFLCSAVTFSLQEAAGVHKRPCDAALFS